MSNRNLSFKEASAEILKLVGKPMSREEISEAIMKDGLVKTEGKTPEATVAAQIYTDIKNNPDSPFMIVSRGMFALKEFKASSDPKVLVKKHNEDAREKLKARLMNMEPYSFEIFIGELLKKIGFENVFVTKRSADGGIDIEANLTLEGITNVKTIVQVKRWANNVQDKVIRELRGSAIIDQRGLVITTSNFTKPAIEEAKALGKMPISLIDGNKLIELLIKYELGIKKETIEVIYPMEEHFQLVDAKPNSAPEEKHRAIWPLPGGVENYISTLNDYLEFLSNNKRSKKDATKWFLESFEQVTSEQTAVNYAMVPRYMGLVFVDQGILNLTEDGKKYLKNKNIKFLYEVFEKNLYMVNEITELFRSSSTPLTASDILEFINNEYDVGWNTEAQVSFRLVWLANLKIIKKVPEGYVQV